MIPGQKKEREWNDPPIPGDPVKEVVTTATTTARSGFVEFLKRVVFVEKTPVWFIIATFVYYLNAIILYEVVPALMKFRSSTYEINSLVWSIEGWLITILFIYFWIAYFIDYRIPNILKTNEMIEKQSGSYRIGYFIGSIVVGFILMGLFFYMMNGGNL